MVVWGGRATTVNFAGTRFTPRNSGGRYDPSSFTWMATTLTSAPGRKHRHTAVWTGNEMLVWGGQGSGYSAALHSYQPPRQLFLYLRP